jgi:hypothetical protein
MTEQAYYFLGRDGQTRLEHYVEHNDGSLPSPALPSHTTALRAPWADRKDVPPDRGNALLVL